jgi:hypothetical protein
MFLIIYPQQLVYQTGIYSGVSNNRPPLVFPKRNGNMSGSIGNNQLLLKRGSKSHFIMLLSCEHCFKLPGQEQALYTQYIDKDPLQLQRWH